MKSEQQQIYEQRINKVVDYIQTNVQEELTLASMASMAAFSPFHFHRLFSAMVGEPLSGFIRRVRLQRAARLLKTNPRLSITEIALDCGFSSPSTFARSFKQFFQCSATEWKIDSASSDGWVPIVEDETDLTPEPEEDPLIRHWKENMTVEIEHLEPLCIAYVRTYEGYKADKIQEAYQVLCSWAAPRGLLNEHTCFLGIAHDDPKIVDQGKCRYDACIAVPRGTPVVGEVVISDIPGGKYATVLYQGPKSHIEEVYQTLYRNWLPGSGYQPRDSASFEQYLTIPDGSPDCHFELKLCLPVKPL